LRACYGPMVLATAVLRDWIVQRAAAGPCGAHLFDLRCFGVLNLDQAPTSVWPSRKLSSVYFCSWIILHRSFRICCFCYGDCCHWGSKRGVVMQPIYERTIFGSDV